MLAPRDALAQRLTAAVWAVVFGVPIACIAILADRRSMWLDETTSMLVAGRDLAGMAEILRHVDAVFALYYGLLHAWLAFGTGTVHARMLSGVFAIATLPLVYALARRLANREAALLAALTLGTSYTFLRYAVEARPYSLEILLCAASGWCFVSLIDVPRRRMFAAYAATTLLAIYAHPLAILWPVAHGASLAFVARSRALLLGFIASAAAVAVGLLPLAAGVRLNGTHQIDWIPPMTSQQVLRLLQVLAAGARGGPLGHGELALLIAATTVAGAVVLFWSSRAQPALILATWLVLPLAAVLIISVWKPIDETRYVCYVILPAFVLTGVALDALRRSAGAVACAVALVLLVTGGMWQMLLYRGEDWRSAAAFLDRAAPADGVVVYTANVLRALRYAQAERSVPMHGVLLYPPALTWTGDQDLNLLTVPPGLPERAAQTFPRVWVVLSHRPSAWKPQVLTPLGRFYEDVATEHVSDGIEVHELRLRAFPPRYGTSRIR